MSFRSSFKRIIIIEVPAKTPIMRLINNVTIWPISSDWNILLNKYVNDVISKDCVMGINPVNWRTDATPALLHDSITVTLDTLTHVLVVNGYEGNEYHPILGFINVGDIHSCEPWLYSECLRQNIATRIKAWREKHAEETID